MIRADARNITKRKIFFKESRKDNFFEGKIAG